MKKIFILLSFVAAFFAMSCSVTTTNPQGSGLVGSTWTGTDPAGAVITITFTNATTGTGSVVYDGSPYATLHFTYTMNDVSNGSGSIVETTTSGKTDMFSFSFSFINNELYVTAPDYFSGTIKFTRSGGQGSGGGTTTSLVGTSWQWGEKSDFYIIVTFTSASEGTATLYDGGRVWLIYSITYTMSGANTGSGIISGRYEDGSDVSEPFSFVISGNNMQVIGPDPDTPGQQCTYIFTKQ